MAQILLMSRWEKSYTQNNMNAIGEVLKGKRMVYKTAKAFGIPRSTLKTDYNLLLHTKKRRL
jgi:hypothetical protein